MTDYFGKKVGGIGYGLMSLHIPQPGVPQEQAFAAMRAALESGCTLWNGGEFYGTPTNNSLTLLKEYYEAYPEDAEKVVLNIKGCISVSIKPDGKPEMAPDCSPSNIRKSVETCLSLLGPKGKIDMFEFARRDPNVPLEDSLKELEKLRQEGKIGGIAMSEVNANTIREAVKIVKIVAIETEFSLLSTGPLTNGILEACNEFGIPVIAYGTVGRGILSGRVKSADDLSEGDYRKGLPRFQSEHFDKNLVLVKEVEEIAKAKGCTASQVAVGWLRTLSRREGMPEIIPIPGSSNVGRVKENSVEVELSADEMKKIDHILSNFKVSGDRYPAHGMKWVDG